MNEQIRTILAEDGTKTSKIRKLLLLGLTHREIADLVTRGKQLDHDDRQGGKDDQNMPQHFSGNLVTVCLRRLVNLKNFQHQHSSTCFMHHRKPFAVRAAFS